MENKNVKNSFVDEKTGIEYIKQGDYYLPNLVLDPEETNYTIGKILELNQQGISIQLVQMQK